jgi:hypothetical protein
MTLFRGIERLLLGGIIAATGEKQFYFQYCETIAYHSISYKTFTLSKKNEKENKNEYIKMIRSLRDALPGYGSDGTGRIYQMESRGHRSLCDYCHHRGTLYLNPRFFLVSIIIIITT